MKVTIGMEIAEPVTKARMALDHLSPVDRQKCIELLMVMHIHKASDQDRRTVLDGFRKHVLQLLQQADKEMGSG